MYDRRLQPTIGAGMKEHCLLARNWAASLRGKALNRKGHRWDREASSAKNPRLKQRHLPEVVPNRKPSRREQHDCHARRRLADDAAIAQNVRRLGGIDAARPRHQWNRSDEGIKVPRIAALVNSYSAKVGPSARSPYDAANALPTTGDELTFPAGTIGMAHAL